MRILVVTNLYPPHHFGGYELLCADTVDRWRAAGHDVHVLTSTWRRRDVDEPDQRHVDRRLPIHWDDHRLLSRSWGEAVAAERETREVLGATIAALRPQVLSVWNPAGMSTGMWEYAERASLPSVAVVADDWLVFAPALDPWASRFAGSALQRAAARLLARREGLATPREDLGDVTACFCSEHTRRRAVDSSRWRIGRHALVPAGIDTDRFPPGRARDRSSWRGKLLFVGRLEQRKGLHTVIGALPQLPGANLRIVRGGETADVPVIKELAVKLGVADRVEMLGEVVSDDLPDLYAAADALVFPSEWDEPFGMVPLEAMACGTPVVATGTGGSGEFLVDGLTALRFAPGDVAALADAVERLAADAELRERLAINGHRAAAWLSRDAFVADITAWHLRAAGETAETPRERTMLPPDLQEPPR